MSVQRDNATGELVIRDVHGGCVRLTVSGWINAQAKVTGILGELAAQAQPKLVASSDFADESTPVMTPGARTRVGKRIT